jgi:hypothetical protein
VLVRRGGGTICLAAGSDRLPEPLRIESAASHPQSAAMCHTTSSVGRVVSLVVYSLLRIRLK